MSLKASFLYVLQFDERWKIPEKSTEKLINFERLLLEKFKTYDHATFQDSSPAHSEFVDTKTKPGKRERGQKRCGVVMCCINVPVETWRTICLVHKCDTGRPRVLRYQPYWMSHI